MVHCKKVYSRFVKDNVEELSKLKLSQLRKMEGITVCEGFVIEAEWVLDVNQPTTEFVCLMCGRRFYFDTKRYVKVLKAFGIDFSGRTP